MYVLTGEVVVIGGREGVDVGVVVVAPFPAWRELKLADCTRIRPGVVVVVVDWWELIRNLTDRFVGGSAKWDCVKPITR